MLGVVLFSLAWPGLIITISIHDVLDLSTISLHKKLYSCGGRISVRENRSPHHLPGPHLSMKKPVKEKKTRKPAHRLTRDQILDYYKAMAYPKANDPLVVPSDLRLKAFEKYVQWLEIAPPTTVVDERTPQKMIIEIKTRE